MQISKMYLNTIYTVICKNAHCLWRTQQLVSFQLSEHKMTKSTLATLCLVLFSGYGNNVLGTLSINSVLLFTKILDEIINDVGFSGPSEFYTKYLWDKGWTIAYNLHFYPNNQMNSEKRPSMFLQHQLFLPVAPCLKSFQGGGCTVVASKCLGVMQSCCGLVCCLSGTIAFQHVFVAFAFSRTHWTRRVFQCLVPCLNVGA